MKTDFLETLHQRATALTAKLKAAVTPPIKSSAPGPNMRQLNDVESDAEKLVEFIAAEIDRPKSRQEYEAEMLDTSPLPGETPEQTANRLDAQRLHNPLVAKSA